MGLIKGQLEYQRWKEGKSLTRKEVILAHCYECNAIHEPGTDGVDCSGEDTCPIYQYFPYRGKTTRG